MKRVPLFIATNPAVRALSGVAPFVIERAFGARLPQGGCSSLFANHPPLDARVAALRALDA